MANPTQQYGIPQISVPVISPDGTMTPSWYRFFSALYQRSGLATPNFNLNGYNANGWFAPQFAYEPVSSPKLIVFDQVTGAGSFTNPTTFPVGFININPLP